MVRSGRESILCLTLWIFNKVRSLEFLRFTRLLLCLGDSKRTARICKITRNKYETFLSSHSSCSPLPLSAAGGGGGSCSSCCLLLSLLLLGCWLIKFSYSSSSISALSAITITRLLSHWMDATVESSEGGRWRSRSTSAFSHCSCALSTTVRPSIRRGRRGTFPSVV